MTRRSFVAAAAAAVAASLAAPFVPNARAADRQPPGSPSPNSALPSARDDDPSWRITDKPEKVAGTDVLQFTLKSPFLKEPSPVRVLLPAKRDPSKPTRFLYLLPVEAKLTTRWGDPIAEAAKLGLPDKHGVICVYPTFDTLPWFGRHATDAGIRHELHLLQAVLPAVESLYRTPGDAVSRSLCGFSKSGFGALSLILRNPSVFAAAGSWDAPLLMEDDDLGLFGTRDHFGTKEVFSEYRPLKLIETADADFTKRTRLVIAGEDSFGPNPPARFKARPHTATFHAELDRRKIRHVFNNDLRVKHHWNTGWVGPVVEALAKLPS